MSDSRKPMRRSVSTGACFTRRDFIKTTSLGVAGLALSCPGGGGDEPGTVDFPLGVACGDVSASGGTPSAVLWTKYVGNGSLKLKLFLDSQLVEQTSAPLGAGGFSHVDVGGLVPGERYRYEFAEVNGNVETGQVVGGHFVSAPALHETPIIRIGAGSCANNSMTPSTLSHAASNDLDAFLFLGDTSYNDDASASVASYRGQWESNLEKAEFRELRGATSLLATWDDHEVVNNWDGETVDPARLAAARQAFFEHMPMRRSQEDPNRIWRSVRWGRTVEVFVLDTRTERLPSTRHSSQPQYISPEQMAWLKDGLEASDAVFKLVAHSVPISDDADDDPEDGWVGYAGARDEILDHIQDRSIPGVMWASGGMHYGAVGRVDTSGPGSNQIEVIAGPLVQNPNFLGALLASFRSQVDWASSSNSYAELQFDPNSGEVIVRAWSDSGELLTSQGYQIA